MRKYMDQIFNFCTIEQIGNKVNYNHLIREKLKDGKIVQCTDSLSSPKLNDMLQNYK